jgi:hypothetical protein
VIDLEEAKVYEWKADRLYNVSKGMKGHCIYLNPETIRLYHHSIYPFQDHRCFRKMFRELRNTEKVFARLSIFGHGPLESCGPLFKLPSLKLKKETLSTIVAINSAVSWDTYCRKMGRRWDF